MQIAQLQAHTAGALKAKHACRIAHMHQGQRRVVLVVARRKSADHFHLFHARHDARWGHLPRRRNQGHRIAALHAQVVGQVAAQHQAKCTRLQSVQHPGLCLTGQITDFGLERGVDATHQHPLHVLTAGQQGLGGDEGRSPHHLWVRFQARQQRGQVGHGRAISGINLDV